MKKYLYAVLLTLFVSAASAQIKFGAKAGVNFSSPSLRSSLADLPFNISSRTAWHAGVVSEIEMSKQFYFQPGLTLSEKGYKLSAIGNVSSVYQTLSPLYLEIPLNVVAKFPAGIGKILLGAGPYIGFGLGGKAKITFSDGSSSEEKILFGKDKYLNSTDLGLNFLAGYELPKGFFLSCNYGLGLSNINTSSELIQKNRVVSVSLGYFIFQTK
ncbi:outer membrane beta-barrel protein [Pedobacter sp. HMF7647]|uniref:Outer membrane beta-barrel protein n=1 Tax=Hufsiella arboris TaxID=2695275 RepID=A0A7K1YDU6_9SPHI|nr:porin family protein [Hufsiella arboris]MXV52531.1 outer membrane beta-barrel protein [Hufsiella arboris]